MNQPIDADIRQQALDTRYSFAVSAPAGSGKTGLLTQRVLSLLAQCEYPENILAITFTKKAAAEMQGRIIAALQNAKDESKGPDDHFSNKTWQLARQVIKRDAEQQWHLLDLPNRLRITTIDSFCRQLSQQMPLSNTLGNTPEVLDTAEIKNAYELAVRETLSLLEQTHPLQTDLIRLIKHFNNQLPNIESLLINLLGRRDQWLGPLLESKDQRHSLESILQTVTTEHLQACQHALKSISGELLTLADYAASMLEKSNKESIICQCLGLTTLPDTSHQGLSQWLGLCELLLTKQGGVRNTIDKRWGFPAADKDMSKEEKDYAKAQKQRMLDLLVELKNQPDLVSLLHNSRGLPENHYTDDQWELLDSLTRVLTRLVAQLNLVFQQIGKTDFIEITLAALNALGHSDQPTDLALAMDYRIQHILVDEFQDTSSPQLNLLKKLTAGWQADDGRTLFVVGDAMQSCYGFRDANVGIFLDIRQQGLGDIKLTPLDLSVNFRSEENIVHWCNTVFADVFPKENKINHGAVKYQQAIAFHQSQTANSQVTQKANNTAVSIECFLHEESISHRTDEAKEIADIILKTQQEQTNGTVAILVRKRSQVNEITVALNNANIEYRATDIDRLETNMLVMDLMNLTRALLYPNDRIAWLALLRAPWCGLNMEDLHAIANIQLENSEKNLFFNIIYNTKKIVLSQTGNKLLQRFSTTLQQVLKQQGRCNLRQWIEGAWLQLGGSALFIDIDEQQIADQFFQLLEKHQIGSTLPDWNVFSHAVSQLYANPSYSKEMDKSNSTVEIMTIHKSKGLEFDTVIIPGLDQSSASDKQQLLAWLEWLDSQQQSQLVISPVHASGNDRDSIHDYIRQQQKIRQQLEADRLFYVGCTRAIKNLHLLAYVKTKNIPEDINTEITSLKNLNSYKPAENSILASIWQHIKDTAKISLSSDSQHTTEHLPRKAHPNSLIRQNEDWEKKEYPVNQQLKAYRLNHYSEDIAIDNRVSPSELHQRDARYIGTILHSALQDITESGYLSWNDQKIENHTIIWQKQLQQLGMNTGYAKTSANKIATAVKQMLATETGCWLLDNQHQDSACELSLWARIKHTQQEMIIDRTFIDTKTNTRWIIDYKSSEPDSSSAEALANFSQKEHSLYRQQLLNYASLFRHEQNVRTALYFPLINHFYEIT
ncbi:MAG: UvrD-helicase domain-containing protein [Cellvibrionaceae bacterium]